MPEHFDHFHAQKSTKKMGSSNAKVEWTNIHDFRLIIWKRMNDLQWKRWNIKTLVSPTIVQKIIFSTSNGNIFCRKASKIPGRPKSCWTLGVWIYAVKLIAGFFQHEKYELINRKISKLWTGHANKMWFQNNDWDFIKNDISLPGKDMMDWPYTSTVSRESSNHQARWLFRWVIQNSTDF